MGPPNVSHSIAGSRFLTHRSTQLGNYKASRHNISHQNVSQCQQMFCQLSLQVYEDRICACISKTQHKIFSQSNLSRAIQLNVWANKWAQSLRGGDMSHRDTKGGIDKQKWSYGLITMCIPQFSPGCSDRSMSLALHFNVELSSICETITFFGECLSLLGWNGRLASCMASCQSCVKQCCSLSNLINLTSHGVWDVLSKLKSHARMFWVKHMLYRQSNLQVGNECQVIDVTPDQHFTSPPPRYSESSLIKALEELGIGRPSTYASIMKTLQVGTGWVSLLIEATLKLEYRLELFQWDCFWGSSRFHGVVFCVYLCNDSTMLDCQVMCAQLILAGVNCYQSRALIRHKCKCVFAATNLISFFFVQDRGYIVKHGRSLHVESRGRMLSAYLQSHFSRYVEHGFTSNVEDELDLISGTDERLLPRQQKVLTE